MLAKQFSWETVNTYFINSGFTEASNLVGICEYWVEFWLILDTVPLLSRTEYTDTEFCEALEKYRNQNIDQSINSENPLIIMFAILDRRLGKKTPIKLNKAMENQPEWLQTLYKLRLTSENINNNV